MKVKNTTAVVDFDNFETLWKENETKQIEFYYQMVIISKLKMKSNVYRKLVTSAKHDACEIKASWLFTNQILKEKILNKIIRQTKTLENDDQQPNLFFVFYFLYSKNKPIY